MADTLKFQLEESAPVHVWSVDLDVDDARLAALAARLDPDETARAQRFHFERDRRRFTAARGVLRTLLAQYLGVSPATGLDLGYGPRGKPFVVTPAPSAERVCFNLSHSYGRALFAFTRGREVGVDLEGGVRLGDDWPGLVRRIFSAREQAELNALPPGQRRAAFLNGWTRKEAYLKATGQGIVDGLQSIEVTLDPARPAALLAPAATATARWTVYDLRTSEDFAAALVVEGGEVPVARFNYAFPGQAESDSHRAIPSSSLTGR